MGPCVGRERLEPIFRLRVGVLRMNAVPLSLVLCLVVLGMANDE